MALQAELKITMFPLHPGQHLIAFQIISHLCPL